MTKNADELLKNGKLNVDGVLEELDRITHQLSNIGIVRTEFSLPVFSMPREGMWFDEEDDWTDITDIEEEYIGEELCRYAEKKAEEYGFITKISFPSCTVMLIA